MIHLSRIDIIGNIDDSTPFCVIEEVLDSHGFDYEKEYLLDKKYINKLTKALISKKIEIHFPFEKDDFPVIATYVNSSCTWTHEKLIEAFEYLQEFLNDFDPFVYSSFGQQTPKNSFSLNACVLYKLCKSKNILTSKNTTIEEMFYYLNLTLKQKDFLIHTIQKNLYSTDTSSLINFFVLTKTFPSKSLPSDKITTEDLFTAMKSLPEKMLQRIIPETNNEAVVLGSVLKQIDLSKFDSPYIEYLNLKNNFGLSDKSLFMYNLNPYYYDLNITFNPEFPEDLYKESQLKKLGDLENVKGKIYEELQIVYFTNNWYPGRWPTGQGTGHGKGQGYTKIYLNNVCELENEEIVCYGIRDSKLEIYTYQELFDLFSNTKKLNGCDNLPLESIHKLKNICLYIPEQSKKVKDIKLKLYNVICEIEFENAKMCEILKELKSTFLKLDNEKKENVENILINILELGMYMRGWDGKSSYPIDPGNTYIDQKIIEFNVTNSLIKLYDLIEKSDLKGLLYKLPLGLDNKGVFQVNTDPAYGLTLMERIDIAKKGESVSTIQTCIRLTSNWIIHSTYYYLKAINKTPLFNISILEHTS